jgi:chromosome segregation ATPase
MCARFSFFFFLNALFFFSFCVKILCRSKVEQLKNVENELKLVKSQLSDKEDQIIFVQKSLDHERDEKMSLLDEKNKIEEEFMSEKNVWMAEKLELKQQLIELQEAATNDKSAKLKEAEINEINQAYHKVIKERESLENENTFIKQEVKRLQMIISSPNEIDHLRSSMFANDEDFGYSSSKNTLEKPNRKQQSSGSSVSQLSEGEFYSLQNSNVSNIHNSSSTSSTFERKLKNFFGFSNRHEGKKFKLTQMLNP